MLLHPRQFDLSDFPCEIGFTETVDYLIEPKDSGNFTQFSLQYVAMEEKPLGVNSFESRFGGHQKLEEREKSFYAHDQTLHCGFVKGPPGFPSTGFDFDEKDMAYMSTCRVAVSSCIFGSSDFLRRPTSKRVNYLLNFFVHYIQCLTALVQINSFLCSWILLLHLYIICYS